MDNSQAAGIIQTALNTQSPIVQALQMALAILQDGYQSDMTTARAEVATETAALQSQLSDANAQVVQLTADKTDLEAQLTTATATITSLQQPSNTTPS